MNLNYIRLLIFLLGIALFVPGLGNVHLFDWDEINFAESAREMLETGNFLQVQINYQPFWEKPPLFMWLQAGSMQLFGVNEFAARLPNAITGIITLIVIFEIGRKVQNTTQALIWVSLYTGSFLPHFYFKTGIIDPLFNLLIFIGIYFIYKSFISTEKIRKNIMNATLSGVFIGLAMLTKGPVALLISGLTITIFLAFNSSHFFRKIGLLVFFTFTSLATAMIWFGVETFVHGTWFLEEFIKYNIRLMNTEDAGHGQPFYYHPVVLLFGCFPASILFMAALRKSILKQSNKLQTDFNILQVILFFVVLILFSIVKTKIIHYSSLCYFPLTYLASRYIASIIEQNSKIPIGVNIYILIIGLLFSAILIVLGLITRFRDDIVPYILDPFAVENICMDVQWNGYEFIVGIFTFIGLIISVLNYKKPIFFIYTITITCCLTLQLALYLFAPKVEAHVQGSLIEFFKSKKNEDCYVQAVGFKSYAQYFYTDRKPGYSKDTLHFNESWLMYDTIDKPAYFVTKCDRDYYRTNPEMKLINEKGGFVMYKRNKRLTN